MGWDHIDGDIDVPYLSERETLRIERKRLELEEDTLFYPAEDK